MILGICAAIFCYIGDLHENFCNNKEENTHQLEINRLKVVIENNPEDLEARFQIAEHYFNLKINDKAKDELLYILLKDNNSLKAKELVKKIYEKELAPHGLFYSANKKTVLDLAKSYSLNQQAERAIRTYKYLLSQKPSLEAYEELGEIYISFGNIKEALNNYKKAYLIKPSIKLRKKVAQLMTWTKNYNEALSLLDPLYKKDPKDSETALLIAEIYISSNELDKAMDVLKKQIQIDPQNSSILVKIADVLAYSGDVAESKKIFKALLAKKKQTKILFQYAADSQIWGDFVEAEKIYKMKLMDERTDSLMLAKLYSSTERYYEAEALYRRLQLNKKSYVDATIGLAETKLSEKDYTQAIFELCALLKDFPYVEKARLLKADIFYKDKKYLQAKEAYLELIKDKVELKNAYLGLGKVYFKEENSEKAKIYLREALKIEKNFEALFYLWQSEKISLQDQKEIIERDFSCASIAKFSDLFLINDMPDMSLALLESVIQKNKNCYPAYIGLIQAYEYIHDYDRAIKIIEYLLKGDPNNYRMLLWKARVLGWSKDYKRSLSEYSKIEKISPNNSLLIREKARVAMWDKDFDLAMETYNSIFKPEVDFVLKKRLLNVLNKEDGDFFEEVNSLKVSLFQGYEKLWTNFFNEKYFLSIQKKLKVEKIFMDLFGLYKNQKAFYMERNAKTLIWDKRQAQAIYAYRCLIDFEKFNEEAFFDLGQDLCELGLCDKAENTFNDLLEIDPLHDRARISLKREEIKSRPEFRLSGTFWKEKGRGDLDQIMRNKIDSSMTFKISCENKLIFTENHYFETPFFNNKTYNADGFSINYAAIASPYLRADFGYSKKYYWDSFKNTNQGIANLYFNINDFFALSLGYLRKDHLENLFCLEQRTQESNYKIALGSFITHRLDFLLEGTYVKFSDGNRGEYIFGDVAYRFTEHPSILKLKLVGEYRNLKDQNIFIIDGPNLVNIIFPYWTPDHYKSGKLVLDWYYDLSKYFFCASQQHYLELKGSYGYDTEKNPAFEVDGEWHIEFLDYYSFGITGLIYRSKIWKADGVWVNFTYRF